MNQIEFEPKVGSEVSQTLCIGFLCFRDFLLSRMRMGDQRRSSYAAHCRMTSTIIVLIVTRALLGPMYIEYSVATQKQLVRSKSSA